MMLSWPSLFSAQLDLKIDDAIADGRSDIMLMIEGVNRSEASELQWNIPTEQLSPISWIGDTTGYLIFTPKPEQIGSSPTKIELTFRDNKATAEVQLMPSVEILTSSSKLSLKKTKTLTLGLRWPSGLKPRTVIMKASFGTITEVTPGERWTWKLNETLPASWSVLLSCHDAAQPSQVLGTRTISILDSAKIAGVSEEGSTLSIEMGGVKLGPFEAMADIPPVDIPSGVNKVVIIAKDEAGNESRAEQKVNALPDWPLQLIPSHLSIPLGGIPIKVNIKGLPSDVPLSELTLNANLGSTQALSRNPSGICSFIYVSPATGEIGVDTISLAVNGDGVKAKKQVILQLVAPFLEKTELQVVEVKRSSDGGLDMSYAMTCLDGLGNKISGLGIELSSTFGRISEVQESSRGVYAFSVLLPPGLEPDQLDLELKLVPTPLNIDRADVMLWDPPSVGKPKAMVLLMDDQGHPLGKVNMNVKVGQGPWEDFQTSASGLMAIDIPQNGSSAMTKLSFRIADLKGWTRRLWVPQENNIESWRNMSGEPALNQTLYLKMETLSSLDIPVVAKLPKKGGEIQLQEATSPTEIVFNIEDENWIGDGEDTLDGEVSLLNDQGILVPVKGVTLRLSQGRELEWTDLGTGRYRFSVESELIEKTTKVDVIVEWLDGGLRETYRATMTPPDQATTEAVSETETTETVELTSEEEAIAAALSAPTLSASQTEAAQGESITLSVSQNLSDGTSAPDGTELSISSTGQGALSASSVSLSGGSGTFSYTFTEDDSAVSISISNDGGSASVDLTMTTAVEATTAPLGAPVITASKSTGTIGEAITLTIDQSQTDGEPAPDGTTMAIEANGAGALSSSSVALSGGSGTFTYTLAEGDSTVSISISNDGGSATVDLVLEATEEVTQTITLTAPEVSPSTASIEVGETLTFTITQTDDSGEPAPDGTSLNVESDGAGALSTSSVSLSGGSASFDYTVAEGDLEVNLNVSNDGGLATAVISVEIVEVFTLNQPTLSASASDAATGESITFTVTQLQSDGSNAPDGTSVDVVSSGLGDLSNGVVTLSSGTATFTYTMSSEDETVTTTVSNDGGSTSLDIAIIPPEILTPELSIASSEVTYDDDIRVDVTVNLDNGNAAEDGTTISVSHNGEGTAPDSLSTSGGKVTWVYQTADVTEEVTASFTTTGGSASVSFNVNESEKPPAEIKWTSTIPSSLRIGESLDLSAEVLDENGDPVIDGTSINWKASKGSMSSSSTSTSSGIINNTWTPSTSIGTVTLTVSYESVSETVDIDVTAGPMDRDKSSFSLATDSIEADGSSTVRLEGELRDAYNNLIDDLDVEFNIVTIADYVGNLSKENDSTDASGIVDTVYTVGFGQGDVEFQLYPKEDVSEIMTVTLSQVFDPVRFAIETSDTSVTEESPPSTIIAGESLTLYAITRDGDNNLVDNREGDWSFTPATSSSVQSSDFTVSADGLSTAFNASGTGSVTITLDDPNNSLSSDTHTITVQPGELDAFSLSTTSSSWVAGVATDVVITGLDDQGNIKTDLNTSLALTFSGLSDQGGSSATHTQSATVDVGSSISVTFVSGEATLSFTPVKVESASLTVTGSGVSEQSTLNLDVSAGALDDFTVETVRLSGSSDVSLVVTALDVYDNVIADHVPSNAVTFSLSTGTEDAANLLWFNLPTGASTLGDGRAELTSGTVGAFNSTGELVISVTNTLAEVNVFQVSEGSVTANSSSFTWSPDDAIQLVYGTDPPDEILQDQIWSSFSVQVLDNFGNLVDSDNGRSITLTTIGGSGTLTNFTASTVAGVATFDSVVATSPGTLQYEVTATGLRSTIAWETDIVGGAPASLSLSIATSSTAGETVAVTVQVLNGAETLVEDYTGTLTLSSSDDNAVITDQTFLDSEDGEKSFNVTFNTAGSQTLKLTDSTDTSVTITSDAITVNAGTANALSFSEAPPRAIVSETWPSFTVHVVDDQGNIVTSATETVTINASGGAGSTSGTLSVAAVNGVASFSSISHDTQETLTLNASATGLTSTPDVSVEVTSPGFYGFNIETPFTELAMGEASLVNLITAVDAIGDTVTDYTGTVRFSSTDGSATLPNDYVYTAGDLGVVAFTNGITFNSVGSHTFTVQDTTDASSATTSSTFSISASSKPSVKATLEEAPVELSVSPSVLRRKAGQWGEVNIVANLDLLKLDLEKPVVLRLLSGEQQLWTAQQRIDSESLTWTWSPNLSGTGVGVYQWELMVFNHLGELLQIQLPFECIANIELGRYGP